MEILIKGGKLIDCNKSTRGDIYIKNEKIEAIGSNLNYNCKTIKAEGLVVLPAFIDMHAHFRDPGYTYKEDIYTGSLAALKGGYTLVNLMGNTNPVCSSMDTVEYILEKSKKIDLIDIHQTVSITGNFDGKNIDHIDNLDNRVKVLSDDGKGVLSNNTMYRAMIKAKEKDLIILSHAEDEYLTLIDNRLSENIMTLRDIYLSKVTGAKLHIAHVSTKEAMEEIIKAKREKFNITCEVTPHHIALHDYDYKVNPPIRKKEDTKALIKAIQEGFVDVISTDHAPHTEKDKEKGACGISGIETAFSICYTILVKKGYISLNKLSQLMSANPSRLMKSNKGKIDIGYDGDLVLVDLNNKVKVNSKNFISKGKNTPFYGKEYLGEIIATIKSGEIKYSNGGIEIDNR
ncbi:MAG TPA: dihydroorotase [Tissierellales bacterium]|nr:dihydroorotase [Tissierellales bacterium]